MEDLIYLTNDLGSYHTKKREWFLTNIGFRVILLGYLNSANQSENLSFKGQLTYNSISNSKLLWRFIYAFKLIFVNRGKARIIVRGIEFIPPLLISSWFFSSKVYYFELTDYSSRKGVFSISKLLVKLINQKRNIKILSTSPFYLKKCIPWYNWPKCDWHEISNVLPKIPNERILYAGFLRGISFIKTVNKYDFYGLLNIKGEKYPKNINYLGSYQAEELPEIYSRYKYSYIDDNFGENSQLNLTNRLFESILNYTIPVSLKKNCAQQNWMINQGIIFLSNDNEIQISTSDFLDITTNNKSILKNLFDQNCKTLFAELNGI